jgi:chaperonin GroES
LFLKRTSLEIRLTLPCIFHLKFEILSQIIHWHNIRQWGNESKKISNMSIKFKPLADRVLIEPAPAEQKTASGIIIPDTAKEKPLKGKIVAAGLGKKDEPMTVKVGDEVLYGQYSGTEIKLDGTSYLIMRESDIYGIF